MGGYSLPRGKYLNRKLTCGQTDGQSLEPTLLKMTSEAAWLTLLCLIWGDWQAVCVRWRWETTLGFLCKLSRQGRWGGWKMSGNSQNLPCSGMPAVMTALWVLLTSPPNDWVDVSHKSFLWFSAYTRFPLKGAWTYLFPALEFGLLLTKVSDMLPFSRLFLFTLTCILSLIEDI